MAGSHCWSCSISARLLIAFLTLSCLWNFVAWVSVTRLYVGFSHIWPGGHRRWSVTRADVQSDLLQLRGCLRVLSWVLCCFPFLSTTSVVLSDTPDIWYSPTIHSCPHSQIVFGINRIAHDVGVIANYAWKRLKLNLIKSKVLVLGSLAKYVM